MRFDDTRIEWRISDIERKVEQKADSLSVYSMQSDIMSLETSRERGAEIIERLQCNIEGLLSKIERMEERITQLEEVTP